MMMDDERRGIPQATRSDNRNRKTKTEGYSAETEYACENTGWFHGTLTKGGILQTQREASYEHGTSSV